MRQQQAAFIPFSLGPRRCIGEYFAMLEMKIHLASLVPLFRMQRIGSPRSPVWIWASTCAPRAASC